MQSKKIICSIALIIFAGVSCLWAGDVATFVDLGFSPDGRTFMFGQYGVQSGTLRPWAELFVVDVPNNNFVSGGRLSYTGQRPVVSGNDGQGALHRLIAQNAALAERHRIDYTLQGQPLFITLDNSNHPSTIEFRNFETGDFFRATLFPIFYGSGADLRSSFYITLERTERNGSRRVYTVGTPQVRRPLISSYRIRTVMIAPHDGSMIMVIEMRRQHPNGTFDIRYMVEALRL